MIPKSVANYVKKQAEHYRKQAYNLETTLRRYEKRAEKEGFGDAVDLVLEVISSNDQFTPSNHILLSRLVKEMEEAERE